MWEFDTRLGLCFDFGEILENGFDKTCDLLSAFVLILALIIFFSDLPGEAEDQEYEDSLCGEEYEF